MNEPVAKIIDLGFSIADGEEIKVAFENQTLRVSFVEWQEQTVTFTGHETIAFHWQEADYVISDQERFDSAHEIIGSAWLRQHVEQGMALEARALHHYKLNFNAAGILELICAKIQVNA